MAPAPHPSRRSFLLCAASLAALIPLASCSGGSGGPTKDTTADKGLPVQGTCYQCICGMDAGDVWAS